VTYTIEILRSAQKQLSKIEHMEQSLQRRIGVRPQWSQTG